MKTDNQLDLTTFLEAAGRFAAELAEWKQANPPDQFGWYPYDSMTVRSILERLLERDFHLLPPVLEAEPVLDIGCADGDLSFFLESLGADVDAIDYSEMNFNQLRGARKLREHFKSSVGIHSVNLDWYFELPRERYGLILFLGTLYHLKNPYYVLETLARRGGYCLLSTRVARTTARGGVPVKDVPMACLLDPREANDDSTNYWIFSEAGLLRLVERTGWSVVHKVNAGCLEDSNPIDGDADERMFLLLKSRIRYPEMHIRLLDGWHQKEEGGWRWTAKAFSFEVRLPKYRRSKEFALAFSLPEGAGEAALSCEVDGEPNSESRFAEPGSHTFRGTFPDPDAKSVTVSFHVRHGLKPTDKDTRDLGVMINFADELAGGRSGLPFRVS